MSKSFRIAQKEVVGFVSSPVAYLFLGVFLSITLFIFFWVSAFFSRNIADIRPLFQWMPILLIFLVGALTMRMWSEERRAGTVEFLLTLPISTFELVLGKFLACMALVITALILTFPIPVTVNMLGDLDWGPVIGAYVASIFLAGAYSAIGLFVSARSDNQIVSLISTTILCFVFYVIGSPLLTPYVGNQLGETLQLFGTGARFESITRGVLDARDLYYYLSLIGIFIACNVYSLERLRWSVSSESRAPAIWRNITLLLSVNFLIANVWLSQINTVRVDLTENQMYSISEASTNYLSQLQEPLLIRGYFSEKTHPLLAPLVPQVRDLIKEYAVIGKGKVRAEFVDPRQNAELEEEANQKYGIKPVPFQISGKYDVSLVNSYFDILIQYGDKHEVITFQDLIEVKFQGETNIDVKLRNPEYDITSNIKKVLYGFQNTESLFQSLTTPLVFKGFISSNNKLPTALQEYREKLNGIIEEYKEVAGDKLIVEMRDPDEAGGGLQQEIEEKYGFRPMVAGLFAKDTFYFYTVITSKEKPVIVPLPEDLSEEGARRTIEAALKRFSPGFLKTVGLVAPPPPVPNQFQQPTPGKSFRLLQQQLSEGYTVKTSDLSSGQVAEDIDLLMLAAPKSLDQKQLFAVDQFLMKGGTVLLMTSPYSISRSQTELKQQDQESGLEDWLSQYGVVLPKQMVFDPQNESYPIPVQRNLGGFQVQEIRKVPYPPFADIRSSGMNQDSLITSGIPQVTLSWSSPIEINKDKTEGLSITELLHSSESSWASNPITIIPNFEQFGQYGFAEEVASPSLLGVILEGSFTSYFSEKDSPLLEEQEEEVSEESEGEEKSDDVPYVGIIKKSPDTARIILYSSNEFLTDQTLQISASGGTSRYMNSLQLMQNTVDWSLEDSGLLSIRSRGHFTRTLLPLERYQQMIWEYGNYFSALIGLLLVYMLYSLIAGQRSRRHKLLLSGIQST